MEKRFAVIVRYESENPDNQYPQDVYWHSAPRAAARRLASLISRRAEWVPLRTRVGTRFYIVDHGRDYKDSGPMSLNTFRDLYL